MVRNEEEYDKITQMGIDWDSAEEIVIKQVVIS